MKIFISYRREDSAGYAGRVRDRLVDKLGKRVFMDVDNIPLGANFVKALQEEVGNCSALLAVIGHDWIDIRDKNGHRRLDHPNDSVRVEIGTALQREIPVIPILLEGVAIPSADQLPEDLQELSLRNGINVHHASFQTDVDRLIRGLKGQPDRGSWRDQFAALRPTRRGLLAAAAATGTAAVAVGAYRVLMVKEVPSVRAPSETPTAVSQSEVEALKSRLAQLEPRRVTDDQRKAFVQGLKANTGTAAVWIEACGDCSQYGEDFVSMLNAVPG